MLPWIAPLVHIFHHIQSYQNLYLKWRALLVDILPQIKSYQNLLLDRTTGLHPFPLLVNILYHMQS